MYRFLQTNKYKITGMLFTSGYFGWLYSNHDKNHDTKVIIETKSTELKDNDDDFEFVVKRK